MAIEMDRSYLPPATFAGISALLHVIALPLSAFETFGPSVVGAVIWAALAAGLFKGLRAVAYLAFLMALFGMSAALGIVMSTSGLSQVTWGAIIGVDALIAATLMRILWRAPT